MFSLLSIGYLIAKSILNRMSQKTSTLNSFQYQQHNNKCYRLIPIRIDMINSNRYYKSITTAQECGNLLIYRFTVAMTA
ncbi:hypothetical protein CG694_03030 [Escherichia coli]|nr:hypothetical protein CG694_03030 [Escherichia coli]